MGVSLYAYRKVTVLPGYVPVDDEDDETENVHHTYVVAPEFKHGLEGLTEFPMQETEGGVLYGPWVRVEDRVMGSLSFSYGGYNQFREALSQTFLGVKPVEVWENPEDYADKPMFDLVQFADNEGVLGPVSCRRLADAFVAGGDDAALRFAKHYRTFLDEDAQHRYYGLYEAVVAAADSGAIFLF